MTKMKKNWKGILCLLVMLGVLAIPVYAGVEAVKRAENDVKSAKSMESRAKSDLSSAEKALKEIEAASEKNAKDLKAAIARQYQTTSVEGRRAANAEVKRLTESERALRDNRNQAEKLVSAARKNVSSAEKATSAAEKNLAAAKKDAENEAIAAERQRQKAAAAEAKARKAAEEKAAREKAEAEAKARKEAERQAKLKAEAEAKAKKEAEKKAAAEAKAKKEAEEKAARELAAKKAAEEKAAREKAEAEAKAKKEAEEKAARELAAKKAAEEKAAREKAEAEAKAKKEAERQAKLKAEAEAKAKKEAEKKAAAEAKAKAEAEAKAKKEAERQAKLKAEAEAKAKKEAEKKAAAEAKAKAEAEAKAKKEAERQAKLKAEAEAKAKKEAEKKAAAEAKAKAEAEAKAKKEAERQAKLKAEAEAKAKKEAEKKAAAEAKAKAEAEAKAKKEAERQAKLKAEAEAKAAREKAKAEAKAKKEAEELAKKQAKEKAAAEKLARAKAEKEAKEKAATKKGESSSGSFFSWLPWVSSSAKAAEKGAAATTAAAPAKTTAAAPAKTTAAAPATTTAAAPAKTTAAAPAKTTAAAPAKTTAAAPAKTTAAAPAAKAAPVKSTAPAATTSATPAQKKDAAAKKLADGKAENAAREKAVADKAEAAKARKQAAQASASTRVAPGTVVSAGPASQTMTVPAKTTGQTAPAAGGLSNQEAAAALAGAMTAKEDPALAKKRAEAEKKARAKQAAKEKAIAKEKAEKEKAIAKEKAEKEKAIAKEKAEKEKATRRKAEAAAKAQAHAEWDLQRRKEEQARANQRKADADAYLAAAQATKKEKDEQRRLKKEQEAELAKYKLSNKRRTHATAPDIQYDENGDRIYKKAPEYKYREVTMPWNPADEAAAANLPKGTAKFKVSNPSKKEFGVAGEKYSFDLAVVSGDKKAVEKLPCWNEWQERITFDAVTAEEIQEFYVRLLHDIKEAGYVFAKVDFPTKPWNVGIFVAKVNLGQLGNITVRNARHYSEKQLRDKLANSEGRFNYIKTYGDLFDLNASPDLKLQTALKPVVRNGRNYIDADITVADTLPVHGSIQLRNDGASPSDEWRVAGTIQHLNVTDHFDTFTAQWMTSLKPEHFAQDLNVLSASYYFPVSDEWAFTVFGGWNESKNDNVTPQIDVQGRGYYAGLNLAYVFRETAKSKQQIALTWLFQQWKKDSVIGDIVYDRRNIHISLPGITLSHVDKVFDDFAGRNFASISIQMHKANKLGASDKEKFQSQSAPFVDGDFIITKIQLGRFQRLFAGEDAPGKWSAFLRADIQLTNSDLPENMRSYLGGMSSIRGYYESEISGDTSVATSFELRTPLLENFIPKLKKEKKYLEENPAYWGRHRLQFIAFTDWGWVENKTKVAGQSNSQGLWSIGLGVRLGLTKYSQMSLDYGFPLIDATEDTPENGRWHLSLQAQF